MGVGFRSGSIWTEFGDADLLHSFFSSISHHLENSNWGSKYPYLQKKFYYEGLHGEEALNALNELKEIRGKFKALKLEDIIWDVEDLTKKPPTLYYSNQNASDLSECFISIGGKNLFDMLIEEFEFCKKKGISVKIQSEGELNRDIFSK